MAISIDLGVDHYITTLLRKPFSPSGRSRRLATPNYYLDLAAQTVY